MLALNFSVILNLTCKFCQVFVHKLRSFILVCSVLPCTGPDESWHEIYRPLKQFLPLFPWSLSKFFSSRRFVLLITVKDMLSWPAVDVFVAVSLPESWVVSLQTWRSCTPWLPSKSIGSSIRTGYDLAFCISLAKELTMFSWVRVLNVQFNGAGASWVVRETIASSHMFTLFSAVRSLLCEGKRSMVLWRRWPAASFSSSLPKLLCGAVTATPLQTSLCLRFSIFLLARPKQHANLSPFSESMEVSRSTGRREPLTTF